MTTTTENYLLYSGPISHTHKFSQTISLCHSHIFANNLTSELLFLCKKTTPLQMNKQSAAFRC